MPSRFAAAPASLASAVMIGLAPWQGVSLALSLPPETSLWPAAAAAQTNPFDVMQRLLQQGQQQSAPSAYAPADPQAGPSRLQQHTAAPASRGDEPTALVEAVSGASGVELMDYVYPGQVIDLGAKGSITLAHFESCVTETIRGGLVTVGEGSSDVSGGKLSAKETPCQGAKPIITAEASEAGAAAKRFGKGGSAEREFILKSGQPVFKWESPSGQATELAVYLDGRQPKLVWSQGTKARHLTYPASAPKLEAGEPYRVEATLADGRKFGAMFSIDPGLEVADNPANRLVALGP